MKYIALFFITTLIFFAIDMLWLGVIAKNFYREKLSFIFTGEVNWQAAFIFYILYIVGILYFVIIPGFTHHDWKTVLFNGAFLGFLCYATYDLTNMATIKQWPLIVVVVDIIWGTVLTGSVAVLSYFAASRFLHF
ncbi:MAG: DUF2177 family protein [Chitinophagales bacterium]|nr:DUF2177 family protein [Chitinophagales bacterium]